MAQNPCPNVFFLRRVFLRHLDFLACSATKRNGSRDIKVIDGGGSDGDIHFDR